MCIFTFSPELSRFVGTVAIKNQPIVFPPPKGLLPGEQWLKMRMTLRDINHPALLGATQHLPLWLLALKCRRNLPLLPPIPAEGF